MNSPQKIVILQCTIFLQSGPCWRSMQLLPYSAIFAQILHSCSLDEREQPVTSNEHVILRLPSLPRVQWTEYHLVPWTNDTYAHHHYHDELSARWPMCQLLSWWRRMRLHPITPVCGRSVARSRYTVERCSAVLWLKLISITGHSCIHVLLLSAQCLVTGMTHKSEAQASFWQISTCNDLCNEFAGIS